ncbi:PAS domain-containing protein [Longimicrobium sp.]|uniref:PAS domain-containing protein n=1 Tax=Longimicrobium sp. TaxID=2029185 RepID=UPI002E338E0B|nr:PAS domain-containing protein [Longimicrobium sp.]HEX6042387.1 PAS domain-containing protein [Longimicrobium sp.]
MDTTSPSPLSDRGTCVLCDRTLGSEGPRSGPTIGFCPTCAGDLGIVPVENLLQLGPSDYDRLPFGFITVDRDGVIQRFNAFETAYSGMREEDVLGRNFFQDVAPCTSVRDFEGRFRTMIQDGSDGVARFRYVFRFGGGERLVQVSMTFIASEDRGIIIVRDLDAA